MPRNRPESGTLACGKNASIRHAVLLRNRLVLAGVVIGAIEFGTLGVFDAVWTRLLTDLGASITFVGVSFTAMALPPVLLAPRFGRHVDRKAPMLAATIGIFAVAPAVLAHGRLGVAAWCWL